MRVFGWAMRGVYVAACGVIVAPLLPALLQGVDPGYESGIPAVVFLGALTFPTGAALILVFQFAADIVWSAFRAWPFPLATFAVLLVAIIAAGWWQWFVAVPWLWRRLRQRRAARLQENS